MVRFDSEEFLKRITQIWGDAVKCPMCNSERWIVDQTMFTPNTITENGGIAIGNTILPLVPVTCQTCGNTIFVNAKVIGAVQEVDETLEGKGNE